MREQVTIVILNWNGLADTLSCLASLANLDHPAHQVVVVDNGSTDGSAKAIREQFSDVTLIENQQNLGFTGGNNVGVRHALATGTDYVLLLNNDTEVAPDFLQHLLTTAQADPALGIVGPLIYYHSQPDVIWSAGGAIDWRRGSTRMVGLDERDTGQFGSEPQEVDFVSGCAMLVRRSVLEQVGLLDERFFAYYEEVEWCVRVRRAGFRILRMPRSRIWHKISPQRRADSPIVHYYMTRNQLLFLRTARAGWQAWLHTLVAEDLRTLISWSVRPKWRSKNAQRHAMLLAIRDACQGRWGQRTAV